MKIQSATLETVGIPASWSPNPKSPPSAQYPCHTMKSAVHANA